LLGDHAELQITKAEAAIFLRHRDPGVSHFGEALPERAVVRDRTLHLGPHGVRAAFGFQVTTRRLAERFLVVREFEMHGCSLAMAA
jgi:hypothetical protein